MNKFKLGLSLLSLSAICLLNPMTAQANSSEKELVGNENNLVENIAVKQVSSNEVVQESSTEEISYKAADLLPEANNLIASKEIDLNEFCKNYPYNSRCKERSNPEPQGEETKSTEVPTEVQTSPETKRKSSGWAITPESGTLGLGASVTKSLTPNLNAKVGVNGFSSGVDVDDTDVKIKADLNLFNVSTLVDYHPFKNSGFRLTGGVVFNNNKIEGKVEPNGTNFDFNGTSYSISDIISSAKAKISLPNTVAPYLGIGWGNAVKPGRHWSFGWNIGAMFAGSPQVSINADIKSSVPDAERQQILTDIKAEEKKLQDSLNAIGIYPVISVGVSYQF
jgi:hypothetical protein